MSHGFPTLRTLAATAAAALLLAAPAGADYYLSKGLAQFYTGHYARQHHPIHKVSARCRPKGYRATPHGKRVFHRWMCHYGGYDQNGEFCTGLIQVKGGSEHNVYWWLVYRGLRCRG